MMRFLRSQEPIMLQGNIWSKSTFWMSEWVGCFHSLLKFSEQRSKCSTVYDQSLSSAKQRPNYHFLLFSKSQTTMQCLFTVTSGFGEVSDCSFISFLVSESNIFSISASVGFSDGATEVTSYSVVRISVGSL